MNIIKKLLYITAFAAIVIGTVVGAGPVLAAPANFAVIDGGGPLIAWRHISDGTTLRCNFSVKDQTRTVTGVVQDASYSAGVTTFRMSPELPVTAVGKPVTCFSV